MKRHTLYIILSALAMLGLTACGDYLDKVPDDRATIDSQSKVDQFLVSAYANHMPWLIMEMASDNVTDNGAQYNSQSNQNKIYRFQDDTYTGNDDPYTLWNEFYYCVATANQALESINEMGGKNAMPGEYAEALLCRAYNMYLLSSVFCMAYNKDSADVYLGLPYPTEPEKELSPHYERGTLGELYGKIDADIEEALPLLSDTHLSSPKYHFNTNAAYAFAARFNLFYGNYPKAIEYATRVLGSNPASKLRDFSNFENLAGVEDIQNAYLASDVDANLMLQTATSSAGRMSYSSSYRRFGHNQDITSDETIWPEMPWGSGSRNNTLYLSRLLYGNNQQVRFPKQDEMFEYTDKIGGTGYAHAVVPVFTADETLLVRAEAEALNNDSLAAVSDINYWIGNHCVSSIVYSGTTTRRPTMTTASINAFYNGLEYEPANGSLKSVRKHLNPQGFKVASGTQENIIQLILQMRRIDGLHDGSRFIDLKRYGIPYVHALDGEPAIQIVPGDKRLAFQLPDDAISNGLTANPR